MRFYADLHVHSKYSRATSGHCDLPHLSYWARRKGIAVIGTGDFTHPAWRTELREGLVPAEPGLFRLRDDLERAVSERLEASCRGITRFLLSVEISTIYKKGERTRKIHHLIYVPDFEAAERLVSALSRIGNLEADGRPILGLDSRHLLEMVLESGEGSYLVPAHIWTPWFSVLGSKAGFDAVEECYGDLSPHIFALETGLSSDPGMNWRVSSLDRYRLVSSSDAHSPEKLGREASVFDVPLDYFAIRRALETGEGFGGTAEFFPEEGKYHLDGHRKCHVVLLPAETRARGERCTVCGQPLTVGVLHRVEELSDREEGVRPEGASDYRNLVPLPEILAELHGVGAASKAVQRSYDALLSRVGPELFILEDAPLDALDRAGPPLFSEAVSRMREGRVLRKAGYDGEYGTIRLFDPEELRRAFQGGLLFNSSALSAPAVPAAPPSASSDGAGSPPVKVAAEGRSSEPHASTASPAGPSGPRAQRDLFGWPSLGTPASGAPPAGAPPASTSILAALDPDQRAAAEITEGPLLILAGPGTGKTRTLTHRIAHLVAEKSVAPEQCLAITFTRRAAEEMRDRLRALLGSAGERVPATTFHALGLSILREQAALESGAAPGLSGERRPFAIAGEQERAALLAGALSIPERKATRLLAGISTLKRMCPRRADAPRLPAGALAPGSELDRAWEAYERELTERRRWDFDDLVGLAVELLEQRSDVLARLQQRYRFLSIDEYQDIDERQYRLVRALIPPRGDVCAIGDPDQAIYGFRGADVGFFLRFQEEFPSAHLVRLRRNYRSTRPIVESALEVVAPSPTLGERELVPLAEGGALVSLREAPTERSEAEFVVHTIERMIGGSTFFSMDSGRVASPEAASDLGFSDFAVLYRTDAQAEALCEAFSRSGMPFQKRSHRRLAARGAAVALAQALRAAPSPRPIVERLKEAAARLREEVASPGQPPDGGVTTSPPGESAAEDATGEDPAEIPAEAPTGEADIDAALELLLPLAERCGRDLDRFMLEVSTGAEVDTWDPRADRVSLLTFHAAKGLEFRVVFLVGCEDGLLPFRFSPDAEVNVDEERRLFYVGMTRARERLFLSHARERQRHGRTIQAEISPFVRAIDEHLIERNEAQSPRKAADQAKKQLKLF